MIHTENPNESLWLELSFFESEENSRDFLSKKFGSKYRKKETLDLARNISEEDIITAKSQIKGSIILAMESTDSRMNRLAKGEYYFGRYISLDEIINSIEAVTRRELVSVAEEMINTGRFTIVAVGPVSQDTDLFGVFNG